MINLIKITISLAILLAMLGAILWFWVKATYFIAGIIGGLSHG